MPPMAAESASLAPDTSWRRRARWSTSSQTPCCSAACNAVAKRSGSATPAAASNSSAALDRALSAIASSRSASCMLRAGRSASSFAPAAVASSIAESNASRSLPIVAFANMFMASSRSRRCLRSRSAACCASARSTASVATPTTRAAAMAFAKAMASVERAAANSDREASSRSVRDRDSFSSTAARARACESSTSVTPFFSAWPSVAKSTPTSDPAIADSRRLVISNAACGRSAACSSDAFRCRAGATTSAPRPAATAASIAAASARMSLPQIALSNTARPSNSALSASDLLDVSSNVAGAPTAAAVEAAALEAATMDAAAPLEAAALQTAALEAAAPVEFAALKAAASEVIASMDTALAVLADAALARIAWWAATSTTPVWHLPATATARFSAATLALASFSWRFAAAASCTSWRLTTSAADVALASRRLATSTMAASGESAIAGASLPLEAARPWQKEAAPARSSDTSARGSTSAAASSSSALASSSDDCPASWYQEVSSANVRVSSPASTLSDAPADAATVPSLFAVVVRATTGGLLMPRRCARRPGEPSVQPLGWRER
mmetsp:Transcript_81159/g.225872  ORF Transcript_81159/g.225872 Transcript_81159/m.225872 type:complete len:562 (-) Transcript_81159:89-1774(-)